MMQILMMMNQMRIQVKTVTIKGNKLFLENDRVIYLTKEMIAKFDLNGKTCLDDETFYSLIYFRIKLSAYNMLAKRDYFKKELKNKLIEKIGLQIQLKMLQKILKKKAIQMTMKKRSLMQVNILIMELKNYLFIFLSNGVLIERPSLKFWKMIRIIRLKK